MWFGYHYLNQIRKRSLTHSLVRPFQQPYLLQRGSRCSLHSSIQNSFLTTYRQQYRASRFQLKHTWRRMRRLMRHSVFRQLPVQQSLTTRIFRQIHCERFQWTHFEHLLKWTRQNSIGCIHFDSQCFAPTSAPSNPEHFRGQSVQIDMTQCNIDIRNSSNWIYQMQHWVLKWGLLV